MYIRLNNIIYNNITRNTSSDGSVLYHGDSIIGISSLPNWFGVYSDDGFELRNEIISEYDHVHINEHSIKLCKHPDPIDPDPPEPSDYSELWDMLAAAISEGVNEVE